MNKLKVVFTFQGWTDNEMFGKIQGEQKRFKRSSLTLPKVKRDDDSKLDKENVKPSNVKLPDIRHANSSNGSAEQARKTSGEKKEVKENGKSRSPKKSKFVKRLSNGERVKRTLLEDNFDNCITTEDNNLEKKQTPEATILRITGGVELVPLLARRRRIGARTLPSSDVTRPSEQTCQ